MPSHGSCVMRHVFHMRTPCTWHPTARPPWGLQLQQPMGGPGIGCGQPPPLLAGGHGTFRSPFDWTQEKASIWMPAFLRQMVR